MPQRIIYIEFGEGEIIIQRGGDAINSRGGAKKILGTPSAFLPPPLIFSLQILLNDNGKISFHVFFQFFCFLMQK